MEQVEDTESANTIPGPSAETAQKNKGAKPATSSHLQIQEYSWEWGAFPTPSPMKATFSKSGRLEGPLYNPSGNHRRTKTLQIKNGRLGGMQLPLLQDSDEEVAGDDDHKPRTHRGRSLAEKEHGRSHSVPAAIQGSPNRRKEKRRKRQWKEYEDYDEEVPSGDLGPERRPTMVSGDTIKGDEFGIGGTLRANKHDPTKFILSIEGRRVGFQISILPEDATPKSEGETEDQNKAAVHRFFKNSDCVDIARVFAEGLVNFDTFLEDESIVTNPRLVIRWIGVEQYITRQDGSPLMDALVHWRQEALRRRETGSNLRPVSPTSEDDSAPTSPIQIEVEDEDGRKDSEPIRAQSEPPEETEDHQNDEEQATGNKPTSLSWVQWWSRSRNNGTTRPALPASNSAPTPSAEIPPPPSAPPVEPSKEVEPTKSEPGKPEEPPQEPPRKKKFAKTLRLTSDQLKSLNLQPGPNSITFSLSATGAVAATARIFVWDHTDLVVVSDIDGTITKSDGLGHVFAMIGRDWTHLGVAKLYTDIARNGYKIMYLTSRAIGQADATRGYLKGIKQNDYQLPEGPVIMSPDRLMASLHREVIMRKPEVFKMACLRDIQRLFGEHAKYPFYAGFGNRITDALSYRSVNIPSARIFTIDSTGEVKMELLELAGYKSSYIHMTDLVDQMFPPIHRKWTPEFTDFNYWRAPVQEFPLPDLSPPSPALSARSDTSNQSALARLRNFSLVGSRQSTMNDDGEYRNNQLRQMSSFERLSSTLGFMSSVNSGSGNRSASPDPFTSDDEDDGTLSDSGRRRERRRSITSMPGSLHDHDMDFDDSEDDDEGEYDDEDEEHQDDGLEPEEHAEEAFDEDLLAAGEMQKVPFL
ncbi:hypothetical protein CC2G_010202 [Coprinopsis cinerea AmutBmut pab1-1]|nr:hypothetical protein CC2G_010202 [Coprinopsis cinerea AmutBmut pab1-1]